MRTFFAPLAKYLLLTCAVLFLGITACSEKKKTTIIIHDGQFAETRIIHQMVKQLVEAKTSLTVDIRDEMSPVNSFNQLVRADADLMNSYDGTVLTTFLKLDPKDVPPSSTLYNYVNQILLEKYKLRLLNKLGTNNTYVVAATSAVVDKYRLQKTSDLKPVASVLVFGAEHEFFSLEGSARFKPFSEFYDLKFKDTKSIDLSLKYYAIESKNIDVTVTYATDGMSKTVQLVILEDDRHFFPEYNGALLVRDGLFAEVREIAPNLEEILNKLEGIFTDESMRDLSYQVDVEGRTPEEMARKVLQEKGLLP